MFVHHCNHTRCCLLPFEHQQTLRQVLVVMWSILMSTWEIDFCLNNEMFFNIYYMHMDLIFLYCLKTLNHEGYKLVHISCDKCRIGPVVKKEKNDSNKHTDRQ